MLFLDYQSGAEGGELDDCLAAQPRSGCLEKASMIVVVQLRTKSMCVSNLKGRRRWRSRVHALYCASLSAYEEPLIIERACQHLLA